MKEYFEKYSSRILLMGLFVFLIHGAKLHSGIVGIDTEDIIHIQNDFYGGWLNTGRQGLWFLKWITNSLNFQPYMAGLLTIIFMTVAVFVVFLLWDGTWKKYEQKSLLPWIAGGLFLLSQPVLTEQFYFSLQSAEICISLCLTVLALYLVQLYCEKRKMWFLLGSTLILILTFSVYQVFVAVFIFGTVTVLFLDSMRKMYTEEGLSGKDLFANLLPYTGVFFVAFLINTLITKLFFNTSDYLGGQVLWGKFAIKDNIKAILGHVFRVITGIGDIHYHWSFGLLVISLICLVLVLCFRNKGKHKRSAIFALLFYAIALLTTPFLMSVVCGVAPAIRSQLVLPLMTGFLAYCAASLLSLLKAKRVAVVLMTFVCVTGIWSQTATTMSLYYTAEMCYEQDEYLGRALITEIDKVRGEEELPVAFVGTKHFNGNHACLTGEIIGVSFFCHDADVEPAYYWSTRRILGFLHVLGADYFQAPKEKFGNILDYSYDMPVWPDDESIQIYDGTIIIKLSDIK